MKKNILLLILAALILTIFSCELLEDPDPSDPRDNFVGNWNVNEVSSLYGTTNYNVTIIYDPGNSSQVLIKNFYHFGLEIETYAIPTLTSITVPEQSVCNHTVKGAGKLSSNKNSIDWTYSANDGADIDNVTATFTKQ